MRNVISCLMLVAGIILSMANRGLETSKWRYLAYFLSGFLLMWFVDRVAR